MEDDIVGRHLACKEAARREQGTSSEGSSVQVFSLSIYVVLTAVQYSSDLLDL
jgi:hypothetical protein